MIKSTLKLSTLALTALVLTACSSSITFKGGDYSKIKSDTYSGSKIKVDVNENGKTVTFTCPSGYTYPQGYEPTHYGESTLFTSSKAVKVSQLSLLLENGEVQLDQDSKVSGLAYKNGDDSVRVECIPNGQKDSFMPLK
jgi:hypothetical protein